MDCSTVPPLERYQKIKKVGEGTFGVVTKALDKVNNKIVAIKKIRVKNFKDGIDFTALREIRILQELDHPNIIELVDVFSPKQHVDQNINLVFAFCVTDLEIVIKDTSILLKTEDIKSYMRMMLEGLEFLHDSWILHRDLKPSNLLIATDGVLKLADFGLARAFGSPNKKFTHQVVTRWYRAPELLFGAKLYGTAVDMWSVGCIFAELLKRIPYFAGDSDIDQLSKIFHALGTPDEAQWPGLTSLPDYVPFEPMKGTPFKMIFTAASDDALDLLGNLLTFNPTGRLEASHALKHRYMVSLPRPTAAMQLPLPASAKKALASHARSPSSEPK